MRRRIILVENRRHDGLRVRTALALAMVCGVLGTLGATGCRPGGGAGAGADDDEETAGEARGPELVPVEAMTVGRRTLTQNLVGSATIEAESQVVVVPRQAGEVVKLLAEEGQRVGKGQLLAQVDDVVQQLAADRAALELDRAKTALAREQGLAEKSAGVAQAREEAEFAVRAAEIAVRETARRLEETRIVAPIAGVVARRSLMRGEMASPAREAFVLTNTETLRVVLQVPEKELARVREGQRAVIRPLALLGEELTAKVALINPTVDPASGTVRVVLELMRDGRARPGMFVEATVFTDRREDVVALPRRSLVYDGKVPSVFVIDEVVATPTVRRVAPRLGVEEGDFVEVLEGASEGVKVVVMGQAGLQEGAAVSVLALDGVAQVTASAAAKGTQ